MCVLCRAPLPQAPTRTVLVLTRLRFKFPSGSGFIRFWLGYALFSLECLRFELTTEGENGPKYVTSVLWGWGWWGCPISCLVRRLNFALARDTVGAGGWTSDECGAGGGLCLVLSVCINVAIIFSIISIIVTIVALLATEAPPSSLHGHQVLLPTTQDVACIVEGAC